MRNFNDELRKIFLFKTRSDYYLSPKINVDEEVELSSLFEIEAMPTLVVVKNGKEVRRSVGYREKTYILSLLK